MVEQIRIPEELNKCQICSSKENIIALLHEKKIRGLRVDEARFVCRKCYEERSGKKMPVLIKCYHQKCVSCSSENECRDYRGVINCYNWQRKP
jgi:hypothetical protein